jgi:hypothetical protein
LGYLTKSSLSSIKKKNGFVQSLTASLKFCTYKVFSSHAVVKVITSHIFNQSSLANSLSTETHHNVKSFQETILLFKFLVVEKNSLEYCHGTLSTHKNFSNETQLICFILRVTIS